VYNKNGLWRLTEKEKLVEDLTTLLGQDTVTRESADDMALPL
jgi:hypothetical protein